VSEYTLSVSVSPSGSGVVSINPFKSKYTAGEQVTLTATANSGYVFSSWSGDLSGTTNTATITMNSNKTVTANFVQSGGGGNTTYTLSVSVSPTSAGVVYLNPAGGVYTAGTQVTLTAQANSGYVFSSWSGDLSGTTNPATITMNSNKIVTANFVQQSVSEYTLSVSVSPSGSGVVNINPFKSKYTAGEQVTLTAQANSGYVFSNWSGDLSGTTNPATITMNSNKIVTANFVQSGGDGNTTYTLSVSVSPTSAGVVYLNPAGGVYTAGTQIELSAEANIGYKFSDWSGDLVSTQNPVSLIMDSNKVIVANFVEDLSSYTLTININPINCGTVIINPAGGVYTAGTQVELSAVGYGLYEFDSWSGDLTGNQNPITIVMDRNKTITANFIYRPPSTINVSVNKNPFYISKDKEVVFTYSILENNNNSNSIELNLRIYDIKMNLVREIKKYTSSSTDTISWDGKDGFGFLVRPGIYLYKIFTDKVKSNKLGKILVK
jgi:NOL1/NOP2/fmu family ribosome biogenesis protein